MVLILLAACAGGVSRQPGASPLPPLLYVGSAPCAGCHAAAGAIWAASAHAHARDTLREAQHGFDSECLPCHQTGLGHAGGLDHVGCEACHGPASAHLASPSAAYGLLPKGADACVACHTPTNSPDFVFEPYWTAIAHGR